MNRIGPRVCWKIGGWTLAAAVLAAALAGCGGQATDGIDKTDPAAGAPASMEVTPAVTAPPLAAEDAETGWDETATQVRFDGETISVDGAGASADGHVLTVSAGGVYVLSGTLTNGQVFVAAAETDTVRLVFDGVQIENKTGAPLYAVSADKLIVTLAAETENTLTDGGAQFVYADTVAEEPDAALFSKCDLTLNGEGTLTVNAGFGNGIGTKDDLVVAGGAFVVRAARHGLRGRDSVAVHGGSLQITAGGDGVQTNNDEDAAKGWMALLDGRFVIESAHDAVQAETALHIANGQFEIVAGGGHSAEPAADGSDSYKGIKAAGDLTIAGGTFQVDSADDCLHTNGSAVIGGGTFFLRTGDDGVHADGGLTIGGGQIEVGASYEGLEGATVDITGGTVALEASDDGINAAGGSSRGTDAAGRFGRDVFGAGGGAYAIRISGGAVTLHAGGDGLDSNGTIHISGGQVVSIVDSTADNSALDCEGAPTVTGGTIVYGGTGTGAGFGEDSTQSYVYLAASIPAGATVEVLKDGTSLLTHRAAYALAVLAVSTPEIVSGESYEIAVDGTKTTVTAGSGGTGFGPGGGRGGFGAGRPPGGEAGERPGGGEFGGLPEGMDRETLRQAREIIGEAQDGVLTDEQRAQLYALGLTDEQIDRLLAMPGQGGDFPGGGGRPPDGNRPAPDGERPSDRPPSSAPPAGAA